MTTQNNNTVNVFFQDINTSMPVTLRFLDRMLHDGSLVCIKKRWIAI